MLPFARCSEFIKDLTGHHLSQGSLSNFQQKSYESLEGYETEIKKLLLQSDVLHADETGINTNGKQNWIHVLSNKKISFFGHHKKRGKEAQLMSLILFHFIKETWYTIDLAVILVIIANIAFVMLIY